MKTLFAVILSLLATLCATPAYAAIIHRYRLEIRPSTTGSDTIDVVMELEYRATHDEYKRNGFKYVGDKEPLRLSVTTRSGQPLPHRLSFERTSQQWKIEFDLSDPTRLSDDDELRHAVVRFSQRVETRRSWTTTRAQLVWPSQFRLSVMETEYRFGRGLEPDVSRCQPEGDEIVCRPRTPEVVRITRDASSGSLAISALLGPLIGASILWFALRARLRALIEQKGVLPPAPAPSYASEPSPDPQGVFRAPPPLPRPEELPPPVLPEGERATFRAHVIRVVLTAFVPLIVVAVIVTTSGSELSPSWMLVLACIVGPITALVVNKEREPRMWPPFLAAALLVPGMVIGVIGAIASFFAAPIIGAAFVAIADAPPGTFTDGSSSGGSSCGGGGGGCGGGGCGGGGCGG
jgi:hypothetical protein